MPSHRRSKTRQDEIRNELLVLLRGILIEAEISAVTGCFSDGYINGMKHFRSRLDLHNKSLFNNLIFQTNQRKERFPILA